MQHKWPVVPISDFQKLDVRPEDLLANGHFRKCETYRGGGGYDQFPTISEKRLGVRAHQQFIAQLYGCNLDCPYCYVTRSGVWGAPVSYTTEGLVDAYMGSGQEVFHLMGGAPAIYLNQWPELLNGLQGTGAIFHSDLLLTERPYDEGVLRDITSFKNHLLAVDIKGVTAEDYERNTRKKFKAELFWDNFAAVLDSGVNFYMTFTNPDLRHYDSFIEEIYHRFGNHLGDKATCDCFTIPLIEYDAQPFVDILPVEKRHAEQALAR